MLKYIPEYFMSKANTLPTKLGGSKTRWLLNKIKLTWEKYCIPSQWRVNWLPFYIILRSICHHCPISSWISNTILLNVCGGCEEAVALWIFALTDIVSYRKRYQTSTSTQFSCYGVEFRFKCFYFQLDFFSETLQIQFRTYLSLSNYYWHLYHIYKTHKRQTA